MSIEQKPSYLVTGGTGTFGRYFIRTILPTAKRVVAFARDEKKMHEFEEELGGPPNARFYLGDVRDFRRLKMAMRGIDTVIHTAALKRVEQCQRDPFECKHTNVDGTENVVYAALESGVTRAVMLSTDKAVESINVYGNSKALAESLFLGGNAVGGGQCAFSVVRYGNVWGSRGSVAPIWRNAIQAGHPIRMTDPECTRFYMTIDEAVALVLKTLRTMKGGELVVPRLPAYRLADLAEAMGATDIKLTGLPPYEKPHESMGSETSDRARRMTMKELAQAIAELP